MCVNIDGKLFTSFVAATFSLAPPSNVIPPCSRGLEPTRTGEAVEWPPSANNTRIKVRLYGLSYALMLNYTACSRDGELFQVGVGAGWY